MPVTAFFRSYEERREAQHVKAGEHIEIERRGTRAGHQYNLLGHIGSNSSGVVVEPYLITLTTESDTFPAFQHEGLELLYMLEGEVDYRHGDQVYRAESPATACSSTPMRRMGPKSWSSCRRATCRSSAIPQG